MGESRAVATAVLVGLVLLALVLGGCGAAPTRSTSAVPLAPTSSASAPTDPTRRAGAAAAAACHVLPADGVATIDPQLRFSASSYTSATSLSCRYERPSATASLTNGIAVSTGPAADATAQTQFLAGSRQVFTRARNDAGESLFALSAVPALGVGAFCYSRTTAVLDIGPAFGTTTGCTWPEPGENVQLTLQFEAKDAVTLAQAVALATQVHSGWPRRA